jgi:sec-independent protein translocase protein TatB
MFDVSWSHLLAIALVALLVIGPKDLPRVLRTLGRWAGKARAVAREFQSSIDQMIRESELEEVRKEVEQVASTDIGQEIEKSVDPKGELQGSLQVPELTDAGSNPAAPTETATPGTSEPAVTPGTSESGVEQPPASTPEPATRAESAPPVEPAASESAEKQPEKTQTAA